jgi:hypothetical protein
MLKRIYAIIKRRVKRKLLVYIFQKPKTVRASTRKQAQHYIDFHGCPTTRCFPRTTDDAFRHLGCDTEWFFPPEQRWQDKAFMAFGIFCWIVLGFFLWRYL